MVAIIRGRLACIFTSVLASLFFSVALLAQTPECSNGIDDDGDGGTDALTYGSADNSATRTLANNSPWELRTFQREKAAELGYAQIPDSGSTPGAVLYDSTTALFLCQLAGYTRVAQIGSHYTGTGRSGYASPYNNTLGRWNPNLNDFEILNAEDAGNRWISTLVCAGKMPACSDGVDNDGDGNIDFPDDNGCDAANDDSELIHDPDCDGPNDVSERGESQCSDGIDNDNDGEIDYLNDFATGSGSETFGLVNGKGSPGTVVTLVREAIQAKGLPYTLPRERLTRKINTSGGGNRWNDDGQIDTRTVNAVCNILGYKTYVSSTYLDGERSRRYPFGKANFHSPYNNYHTRFINGNFVVQSAEPKYKKHWIATITCKDPLPACSDLIDNDGDGLIDMNDPGCANPNDTDEGPHDTNCDGPDDDSEFPDTECSDGVDNDGDGFIDFPRDPGCESKEDDSERTGVQCDDGLDNDGDGKVDYPADPGCSSVTDDDELNCALGTGQERSCDTGLAGVCAAGVETRSCDQHYQWGPWTSCMQKVQSSAEVCSDGLDNDCDGAIDTADSDCFECSPGTQETAGCSSGLPGICATGTQIRKCAANGTWTAYGACTAGVQPGAVAEVCGDGQDNDCDGATDAADSDCYECQPGTEEAESCSTGNAGICDTGTRFRTCAANGTWDAFSQCTGNVKPGEIAEVCDDQLDNDCDGAVDISDTDCDGCPDDPDKTLPGQCGCGVPETFFTIYDFLKDNPESTTASGVPTQYDLAFSPGTQRLQWVATYQPNEDDVLPDGFQFAVNAGSDPTGRDGEMAFFFFDASDPTAPRLTVYGYNAVDVMVDSSTAGTQTSWQDGSVAAGNQPPDKIVSSVADASFVKEFIVTDNADGTRTLGFVIDATAINAHTPLYPDPQGEPWTGARFDDQIGMLFHHTSGLTTSYGADGFLTNWQFQTLGLTTLTHGGITEQQVVCGICQQGEKESQSCNSGLPGMCSAGTQVRVCGAENQWSEYRSCVPNVAAGEIAEICDDGIDNDCDGDTDSADDDCFECAPGAEEVVDCATALQGICGAGTRKRTCQGDGTWGEYGSCVADVEPGSVAEVCDDGFDNDCDGAADTADSDCLECQPEDWEVRACSSGLPGICEAGEQMRLCNWKGEWTEWDECKAAHQPDDKPENCFDDIDNDCNGLADSEDPACTVCQPGDTESAACDTGEQGICAAGEKTRLCDENGQWGPYGGCQAAVAPGSTAEVCDDGFDNNCDGLADQQDPACQECEPESWEERECDSGFPGLCEAGKQMRLCNWKGDWLEWGECKAQHNPGDKPENCSDGIDNDCDFKADSDDSDCWECEPGETDSESCASGAAGVCGAGSRSRLCGRDGRWMDFGACEPEVAPGSQGEICGDGQDNDCDGDIDSADSDCWECDPGATEAGSCDSGEAGVCAAGIRQRTCGADGKWTDYGSCVPKITPGSEGEVCGDGKDNDCDGATDSADSDCWECEPGAVDSASCNTGEAGVCGAGTKQRTCASDGMWSDYGSCTGEILPGAQGEVCGDGQDNDCDGAIDSADSDCWTCQPGEVESSSCATGLAGACNAGSKSRTCAADGQWGAYGSCEQEQAASAEQCADGIDNDCDGDVDASDADCVQCVEQNNTDVIKQLDVSSAMLGRRLESLAREYRRRADSRTDRRWGRDAQIAGGRLALAGWSLAWQLPQVTRSCTNAAVSAVCTTNSFVSITGDFSDVLSQMKALRDELETRLRATNRRGRLNRYARQKIAEFDALYDTGTKALQQAPTTTDVCDL